MYAFASNNRILGSIERSFLIVLALVLLSTATPVAVVAAEVKLPVVALIDGSGINAASLELVGTVIEEVCINPKPQYSAPYTCQGVGKARDVNLSTGVVVGAGVAATQWVNNEAAPGLSFSHGSAVASVIAGNTVGQNKDVKLIAIRNLATTADSLSWIVANAQKYKITSVVMSQGTETKGLAADFCETRNQTGYTSAITSANLISKLRSLNIAVFFSSGNSGTARTISSPACLPGVFSVGASTKDVSSLATYSNAATGLTIIGASSIPISIDYADKTTLGEGSGTSFATPLIAAMYERVRMKYPSLTADQIMAAMRESGSSINTAALTGLVIANEGATLNYLATNPTIPSLTSTFTFIRLTSLMRYGKPKERVAAKSKLKSAGMGPASVKALSASLQMAALQAAVKPTA